MINISELTNCLLVFARVSALLGVFPVFSGVNVPVRVRIALAALLAYIISTTLPPVAVEQMNFVGLVVLGGKEVGAGLLLGFVSRMTFFALETVGNLVSRDLGFQMASELDPFTQGSAELPAVILHFLAITLFFALDLHHWLLVGLQRSYDLLPVGQAKLSVPVLGDLVKRTSQIFVIGVQVAAPVMAVSFLITLIFSVLGRAVQQMNVFTESFAIRALAGLATFGLSLQLMSEHISNYLRRLPEDMVRVAQLLGGR